MPTYEYECPDCGHTFERFQSITANSIRTCPACKKRKVRRLIGAGAALIFRGSGFYATDYRSSEYKSEAKADSSSSTSSSSDSKDKSSQSSKSSDSSKGSSSSGKKD